MKNLLTKKIHLAKMIREDGAVSPFCAQKPRVLDLKISSWTIRQKAVTCKKCLDKILNKAEGALATSGAPSTLR